jgi:dephospho-CoA kinase
MLKAGITGGIGSGKTLVCRIFKTLGVPVYFADLQAKKIMDTDPEIHSRLSGYFGKEIIKEGRLDRKQLASIVFNDPKALEFINSLIHPLVRNDFDEWCRLQRESKYVIEEAAILFETDLYKLLDFTITITAPEYLRIKRVVDRDGVNSESVLSRIRNQMDEKERIRMADAVIVNDEKVLIIPQVVELHQKLLNLSTGK